MSVLMGAIYPNQGGQTFSATSFDPAQPTPPVSYESGSGTNPFLPQGNYIPSFPTNQDANKTIKQDSGVFDSEPRNATEPSVMDKVKKYAPYIIGGAVLLYYVMRKK